MNINIELLELESKDLLLDDITKDIDLVWIPDCGTSKTSSANTGC